MQHQLSPATVKDVLHDAATVPLSEKKNTVVAIIPMDTSQNEIPTKSLVCNMAVATAELVIPKKAAAAKARRPNFL